MGGLLILVLFGLYVWVAYKLVLRPKKLWMKAIVILIAVLIPTADAVYGRVELERMCEAEGGLRIYRTAKDVDGFYDSRTGTSEDWVRRDGFRFSEGKLPNGSDGRVSLDPDGQVRVEAGIIPKSRYVYRFESNKHPDVYIRFHGWISDLTTNEILSESINIQYAGGWVERFISGIYASRGDGGNCGHNVYGPDLIRQTLRPAIHLAK